MIININWDEPTNPDVTTVFVYRSSSKDGSYAQLISLDAKNPDGSWVTSFTDSGGSLNYWYKIRFFDGSVYSDYSNPINALYNVRYSDVDKVSGLTGVNITNDSQPTNSQVWDWIGWAEDYVDKLFGYTFKIKNKVEEVNVDGSSDTVYVKNPLIYQINHLWVNNGSWLSPDWVELTEGVDYALVDPDLGMIRLVKPVSGDKAVKVDYDHGMGMVPKDVEQLTTYLVARNLIKQVVSQKLSGGGQSITVGAIKISNKISDTVGFLNMINNTIADLESHIGSMKVWFR